MITWKNTIEIILALFEIRQRNLAELLGIEETALTKIKTGKQALPDLIDSEGIYKKVFQPGPNKLSQDTPESLLSDLKEIIESSFAEVRTAMDDCWNEEDYEKFVLRLLSRTRKSPSVKNKKANVHTSKKEQETEPLDETPLEQMHRIFERAVAEANIARHSHDLADYLENGLLYPPEVSSFLDTLPVKIASEFVDLQNEKAFQKIKEFTAEVRSYFGLLGMVPLKSESELDKSEPFVLPVYEPVQYKTEIDTEMEIGAGVNVDRYSQHWREHRSYDEVFSLIKSDRDILNNKAEIENHPPEVEGKLNQLHFISSIFSAHKRICELFEEITEGKTLLLY